MKNKDLNKLTLSELKEEINNIEKAKDKATTKQKEGWQIGKNYVIRTVTMIQIGKLTDVTDKEIFLESASWIPETDRWMNFLKEGKYKECEPFQDPIGIGRASIIDFTVWRHELPTEQK